MRRRPLLILLLLALVAAAVLVMGTRETGRSQQEELDRAESTGSEVAPARLQGDSAASAPPSADSRGVDPALEGSTEETSRPPVLLRGTVEVEGRQGQVLFDPSLRVTVGSSALFSDSVRVFPVETEVDRAGPFALDLRRELEHLAARHRVEDLAITVDHPGYMPIHLAVPMPDPAAVLAGRAAIENLTLTLREACVLRGVVHETDGAPVADAEVLLYRFGPDGPERTPISMAFTGRAGDFTLRFSRDGRHLVVATWRIDGDVIPGTEAVSEHPPASAVLTLRTDSPSEAVELRLEPSHGLRGVVRHLGEPVAEALVQWAPVAEGVRLSTDQEPIWASGLIWTGKRVLWAGDEVWTDEEGRFGIYGLVSLPHRLRVRRAPGIHPHTRTEHSLVQVATPPRRDVAFDLTLVRLEIRTLTEGRPLPDVSIGVTDVGMAPEIGNDVAWQTSWADTDEEGRSVFYISPACAYFVTAEDDDRFECYQHEFESPAGGETYRIVAEMQSLRPRPALAIVFEGDGADELEVAGFGFYPPDANSRSRAPYPLRDDVERGEDGVFRLADLEPGAWLLHVRPGRRWHANPGAWVETVHDVEIPETGEARLRVTIEKGGRLHLHVTDVDGRHLRATCTILDEHGAEVPAWFVATDGLGGRHRSRTALPGIGPSWVEPVLVPGTYRAVFEAEGYRRLEREVPLAAGLPASVRVILEREE